MIIKFLKYLSAVILVSSIIYQHSTACSVFSISKGDFLVVGRNYDWGFGEGYVMINKKNQSKQAFTYWGESTTNLASWTSKYGSITFNQYGMDIAFGGMNEAGLVVNELWLDETRYPTADSRASMSVDQYVQYLLDNFSSVDEIAETDLTIRVRPTSDDFTKIHFMATDATGKNMIIEFLNGKMVYHLGDEVPVSVMTNHTYDKSLVCWNGGVEPDKNSERSLFNFYRAATLISDFNTNSSDNIIDYSYNILHQVGGGSWTKFSVVFDIKNMRIYFKSLASQNIKYIDFNEFEFSCETNSSLLDINTDGTDNVSGLFIDYTAELNENLIIRAWANLGYTDGYTPALKLISDYPETFRCTQTSIKENSTKSDFDILPNPATDSFTLFSNTLKNSALVEIFDAGGSLIYSEKIQTNITHYKSALFSPGIYVVRLTSGHISKEHKLIIK